ncbi:MAG: hypothetical protein Q9219_005448 [cf. Caloplaca sp. 3 TL-2023]
MEVQSLSPEVIQDTQTAPTPSSTSDTIPAHLLDSTFKSKYVDLISSLLPPTTILSLSNEYFAPASSLLLPHSPIHRPGHFVPTGAWYDGWETRRHNPSPPDWVIIKLGVERGIVRGVEIDTAFFNGNHAEGVKVQGCFEVGEGADERVTGGEYEGWREVLGWRACGGNRRQGWSVEGKEGEEVSHVRLCMYPDGGIARFRLWGVVVPPAPPVSAESGEEVELSAVGMGGRVVAFSEEHFGSSAGNLLLEGRGVDMSDGWETRRSRGKGHVDWIVVRLGVRGRVGRVVVDTAFYRGNFPREMRVEGVDLGGVDNGEEDVPTAEDPRWKEIIGLRQLGPDQEHVYKGKDLEGTQQGIGFTHVKLTIIPDGGVKRFRVFGSRI